MSIQKYRDELETAILLALSARRQPKTKLLRVGQKEMATISSFLKVRPEWPQHVYVLSPEAERLYTDDLTQLICNPVEVARNGLESGVFLDGCFKWMKLAPINPPKTVVALTNTRPHWFAIHAREIKENGHDEYGVEPVALDDKGRPIPLRFLGWMGVNPAAFHREQCERISLMVSVYEDVARSCAYIATVEESVKLSFSVGEDAYLEFFRDRDGWRETPSERRNPIVHWCSRHLRGTNKTPVKAHRRGRGEIIVGPMRLTIEPSPWSAALD